MKGKIPQDIVLVVQALAPAPPLYHRKDLRVQVDDVKTQHMLGFVRHEQRQEEEPAQDGQRSLRRSYKRKLKVFFGC